MFYTPEFSVIQTNPSRAWHITGGQFDEWMNSHSNSVSDTGIGFLGMEYDDLGDSFHFFKSKTKQQKFQHFVLRQPWTRRDLSLLMFCKVNRLAYDHLAG